MKAQKKSRQEFLNKFTDLCEEYNAEFTYSNDDGDVTFSGYIYDDPNDTKIIRNQALLAMELIK